MLPTDPARNLDESVQVWPVDNGNVVVTAPSGVAFLELYPEGDTECHHWIEYGDGNGNGPIQRQITLTEAELRTRLPEHKRKCKLRLSIKSITGGSQEVDDLGALVSKASRVKLSNGAIAFRSSRFGAGILENSKPEELVFDSALHQTSLMIQVRAYHGFALDGIEFFYEDGSSQLFGKRGGTPGGSEFNLGMRLAQYIGTS